MKIYVVTQGEYSDYHIVCVTDDYRNAETARFVVSQDWYEARIETYDTDDVRFNLGDVNPYNVMLMDDGRVIVKALSTDDGFSFSTAICHDVLRSNKGWNEVDVLAKDQAHAKKKGVDLIMKYKYGRKVEGAGNEHTD